MTTLTRPTRKPAPASERAERYINRGTPHGCWEWTGFVLSNGYGQFYYDGRRNGLAHRFMYETYVGPIADDNDIDHICFNRKCVNPDHLQSISHHENLRRSPTLSAINEQKTHCPQGHEYTPDNTYIRKDRPGRGCRICRSASARRGDIKAGRRKTRSA